jgi:hypothetical protein
MASKKKVIDLINAAINPYLIPEKYEKNAEKWSRQYELKTIKSAIEIGKTNYINYTDGEASKESANLFLNKLGGIIYNMGKNPIEQKIVYIINSLPYKFEYYDKDVAKNILFKYVEELKQTYNFSDNEIISKLDQEHKGLGLYRNWTSWKNHFEPIISPSHSNIKTFTDLRDYLILNGLETKFGKITGIKKQIGQGGNSIVCFGILNGENIAVKILINYDNSKKNRFYLEYFNIIKSIFNYEGIVKQYFLDEFVVEDYIFPYIVMKEYKRQLKYEDNISSDELFQKILELIKSLKYIHSKGIVHRDLKPQNILIDENNKLNISDFGIAYFNPEDFALTGHTTTHEKLANFDFSAPEQRNSKFIPQPNTDIYALGQIIQWLVYGETHKGTRRQKIYKKIKDQKIKQLDKIVDRCLCNNPADRFQTVDEIEKIIDTILV